MSTILFTHSYFLRFDTKQWKTGRPYAPIGTLYAASLLRQNGLDVAFFDTMFSGDPEDICTALENHDPKYLVIYDDGFNYLTKMCLTNMRDAAFKMIKLAKQRGCMVIVSSSDSTDHFGSYLGEGADFILVGEAEQTLLELIKSIDNDKADFSTINGIAYLEANEPVKTPRRTVMRDLDSLPLPAWDLIDISPYKASWLKHAGYFSINIATTRGCPFKCNWCAKPIYGNRYNSRSPKHVAEEIMYLKALFQFDHIWFCDDIFGLKPGWVSEFSQLIKDAGLHLKYKIQSRADLLLQENYVCALSESGCENVWMGAESGSQKVLDAMDKGIRVEQIYKAVELLKQYGIKPSFFYTVRVPGRDERRYSQDCKNDKNSFCRTRSGYLFLIPCPALLFTRRLKTKCNRNLTGAIQMTWP